MAALQANNVRNAYLITYSKADLERFDRESFARAGNGDGAANAGEAINVENRRIEKGLQ